MADRRSVVARDRVSWVLAGVLLVGAVTGVVALLAPHLPGALGLPSLYLLAILPVAHRWGSVAGVAVAVVSTAVFGLVIASPRLGLIAVDGRFGVSLGAFLLAACVAAYLAARPPWGTARLLEEQAAVRRISAQAARGGSEEDVFTCVADEVTSLFRVDVTLLVRVRDGTGTFVGIGGPARGQIADFAAGPLWVTSTIRIDDPPRTAVGIPLRSIVCSPVTVEGRYWGGIVVGLLNGLLPADTEQRLAGFTELAGAAIAGAQSRAELGTLLERFPALRAEVVEVGGVDRGGGPERTIGPGRTH